MIYTPENATVYGQKFLRILPSKALHLPLKADNTLDTDDESPQIFVKGNILVYYVDGVYYSVEGAGDIIVGRFGIEDTTTPSNRSVNLSGYSLGISNGFVGIGTATPNVLLNISGNYTGPSWMPTGTSNQPRGIAIGVDNATYTDNVLTGSGTTFIASNTFGQPTFAFSSGATTIVHSATVLIQNAPAAGTNATLTNKWALYIAGGASSFQTGIFNGALTANSFNGSGVILTSPSTISATNFAVTASSTAYAFIANNQNTQTTGYIRGISSSMTSGQSLNITHNIGAMYGVTAELKTQANTSTSLPLAIGFHSNYQLSVSATQRTITVKLYNAAPLGTSFIGGGSDNTSVQIIANSGNFYAYYVDQTQDATFANASAWGFYQKKSSGNGMNNYFGGKTAIGLSDLFAPTAFVHIGASVTGNASLRIDPGDAPAFPNDGDIWNDGTHLYYRSGATSMQLGGGGLTWEAFQTLTSGSTVDWDNTISHNAKFTIEDDLATINPTGDGDGHQGQLLITQDGTGSRKLVIPSGDSLADGINVVGTIDTIDLPDAAGAMALVSYINYGTHRIWFKQNLL